jgi:hypothetical protein
LEVKKINQLVWFRNPFAQVFAWNGKSKEISRLLKEEEFRDE